MNTSVEDTVDKTVEGTVELLQVVLWVGGGVVVGLLVAYLVGGLTRILARRHPVAQMVKRRCSRPFQAIMAVAGAWVGLVLGTPLAQGIREPAWRAFAQHGLLILLVAAIAWFVARLLRVLEDATLHRLAGDPTSYRARRIETQSQVMRRLGVAVVGVLAVAAILLTFPGARAAGASLLASAGLLSVVAGLAAQTTLGNVFAGVQLAFTDALRVDDIVIVEGEFGNIEEITLTYVVVRLWDDRRMIMPSTFFTTTPFENWTRRAPELLGGVEIDLDWRVPVPAMRAELDRLLHTTELWDRKLGVLQVLDATQGRIRMRALISGRDAPTLADLKYFVREGLVDWVQTHAYYALPRTRLEEQEVVRLEDDGRSLSQGPLAEEIAELAELARIDGVVDSVDLTAVEEEDTEERRARAAEARRARRRAAREDRRRAREGTLGRNQVVRPSADATQVMDLAELGIAGAGAEAPLGSADAGAAPRTAGASPSTAGTDLSGPPEEGRPARGPAEQPPARRTSIMERFDLPAAVPESGATAVLGVTATTSHESSVFSGSQAAEERAKAFSGPPPEVYEERERQAQRQGETTVHSKDVQADDAGDSPDGDSM